MASQLNLKTRWPQGPARVGFRGLPRQHDDWAAKAVAAHDFDHLAPTAVKTKLVRDISEPAPEGLVQRAQTEQRANCFAGRDCDGSLDAKLKR